MFSDAPMDELARLVVQRLAEDRDSCARCEWCGKWHYFETAARKGWQRRAAPTATRECCSSDVGRAVHPSVSSPPAGGKEEGGSLPWVVVLSGMLWNTSSGGQRPRKLAQALSEAGYLVTFIEQYGGSHQEQADGVCVLSLAGLTGVLQLACPTLSFHAMPAQEHVRRVEAALEQTCRKRRPTLVINCLYTRLALEQMRWFKRRGATVVYDCFDNWEAFHRTRTAFSQGIGWRRHLERQVCEEANFVVTSSLTLKEKVEGAYGVRDVLYLPNAVDREYLARPVAPRPSDLPEGFVVGYVGGTRGFWQDWHLVRFLATSKPAWRFVLVGERHLPLEFTLGSLPNVAFLGPKHYGEIHCYIDHFDICLIPFRVNKLTRAVSPLKVFDYLGRGKPVVSSYLPELEGYPYVWMPHSRQEWLVALDEAATAVINQKTVMGFLQCHTWQKRIEALLEKVSSLSLRSPSKSRVSASPKVVRRT